MAFVRPECSALRCIRLSDKVITDHLTNSYFAGFGRENPAKVSRRIMGSTFGCDNLLGFQGPHTHVHTIS